MEIRSSQTGGVATPPGLARPVAGCPHEKESVLPILPRATYQSYLEGGGGVHTYIPRLQDHMKIKLKRGAPAMGTQPLRPLQIAASASNGAQTRSELTCTYFLPSNILTIRATSKLRRGTVAPACACSSLAGVIGMDGGCACASAAARSAARCASCP